MKVNALVLNCVTGETMLNVSLASSGRVVEALQFAVVPTARHKAYHDKNIIDTTQPDLIKLS
jgi:hypothetical protein